MYAVRLAETLCALCLLADTLCLHKTSVANACVCVARMEPTSLHFFLGAHCIVLLLAGLGVNDDRCYL